MTQKQSDEEYSDSQSYLSDEGSQEGIQDLPTKEQDKPKVEKLEYDELTEDQKKLYEELKGQGNQLYQQKQYAEAQDAYQECVEALPIYCKERSVLFSNLAACSLNLEKYEDVIKCCNEALKVDDKYTKVLQRRAQAHLHNDNIEYAYEDITRVKELDPTNQWAISQEKILKPKVDKKREQTQQEMFGKLKELGNSFLGNFGMSVDNFKFDQNPETGGYNIRYEK